MQHEPDLTEEVEALYACRRDVINDPYPLYHRMQIERPVLVHAETAAISRYDDAEAVLLNLTDFSNSRGRGSRVEALVSTLSPHDATTLRECVDFHDRWLVRLDPPDHTRIRTVAHRVFTPRRVAAMSAMVQETTDQLLNEAADRVEIDVIDSLAYRLPLVVIGSMLGVPAQDYHRIHEWSRTVALFIGKDFANFLDMHRTLAEFRAYLHEMIAERRRARHTDLLAALLAPDESGDVMSAEELQGMFMLLLFAGHDTTTNLIGSGLFTLLKNPDQLRRLRDDVTLLPNATEEFLRYESPNQTVHRFARRTTVVHGVSIPQGTSIRVMIGAANRDPERFVDPDRFDAGREDIRHLAFGLGPHFCLGQALARLEAPIAIGSLLRRFPRIELSREVEWNQNLMFRGLKSLWVGLN
jgi:cytochrome P450